MAIIRPDNIRSQGVAANPRMTHVGDIRYANLPHRLYWLQLAGHPTSDPT